MNHAIAPDQENGKTEPARGPDATVALGNTKVSGWKNGENDWTFAASKSYRAHQSEEVSYSQLTLYARELLPLACCLQQMAEHVATVRVNGHDVDGD